MTTNTRSRDADNYPSFIEGELVTLKSGSPALTILGVCDECDEVDVAYTNSDGDIEILTFPTACILRIS